MSVPPDIFCSLYNLVNWKGMTQKLSILCYSDVVHMSCKMTTDAESDLMPVIEKLFAPLDSGMHLHATYIYQICLDSELSDFCDSFAQSKGLPRTNPKS